MLQWTPVFSILVWPSWDLDPQRGKRYANTPSPDTSFKVPFCAGKKTLWWVYTNSWYWNSLSPVDVFNHICATQEWAF